MAYSSSTTTTRRRNHNAKIPRDQLARRLAQALLLLVSFSDLYLCPHSKVEESFNLQATHDLIYHGLTPAILSSTAPLWYDSHNSTTPLPALPYDHLSYPGVVPRTFVGPLVLSWMIQWIRIPCLWLGMDLLDHPLLLQFCARALVLLATVLSLCQVARAIDCHKHVTSPAYAAIPYSAMGTFFLVTSACQFHLPFYASRMLPNIFALIVVLQSLRAWLLDRIPTAAALLVFGAAVFRCDLLLLLFTVGVSWIVTQKLSVLKALQIGIITGLASLILTVPLDSLLWQQWVWPEGQVLYYNAILGKSSDWGTSPWYWYITSAIPKLLLAGIVWLPCAFLAIPETMVAWWEQNVNNDNNNIKKSQKQPPKQQKQQQYTVTRQLVDTTWWEYLLPALGYIALYSCLGHKEVRFLFPVVPFLNLAIAIGMTRVHKLVFPPSNKEKRVSKLAQVAYLAALASLMISLLASMAFVAVSRQNYPGGNALMRLEQHLHDHQHVQKLVPNEPQVRVYIDVAAAMSGVSLFGQRHAALSSNNSTTTTTTPLEWKFTKAGYEDEHAMKEDIFEYSASFTHIIAETADRAGREAANSDGSPRISTNAFTLVDVIPGKPRMDWKRGKIVTQDSLYLWERIGYWQGIRG